MSGSPVHCSFFDEPREPSTISDRARKHVKVQPKRSISLKVLQRIVGQDENKLRSLNQMLVDTRTYFPVQMYTVSTIYG